MTVIHHLIHLAEISLFFNTTPKHIDAAVPFLQKFRNSVAVRIKLWQPQQFSNSHFHFLILECAKMGQVQNVLWTALTDDASGTNKLRHRANGLSSNFMACGTLILGNACCHPVLNVLSSSWLS
jgi:hypothetical protein